MSRGSALEPRAQAALERVLELLRAEKAAVSSVTDPDLAHDVHIADSLSGLAVEELASAARIADLGSGAGFPGLALAAALPEARVDLIESVGRKCEFMRRAIGESGIGNATVVCQRSEEWARAGGREEYDAVVARAVGSLVTVAELASPLLREGGVLVAWKGARGEAEESRLAAAGSELAMRAERVQAVTPYAGSRRRHLHVVRKLGPTPDRLPRRPGMARKRPLGDDGPRRERH